MKSPMIRSRRTAFTLLELLVVMTIILALIACLMPALDRSGATANLAVCGSNQHQLDLALLNYAADNFTIFPDSVNNGGTWWWDISFDVRDKVVASGAPRNTWYCPSAQFQNNDDTWTYASGYAVVGYAWVVTQSNHGDRVMTAGNQTVSRTLDCTAARTLAADATLCNAAGNFAAVTGGWVGVHRSSHVQPGTFTDEMNRKPTGGNRLQGDGAVAWVPFAKMQARTTGNPQFWW